MNTPTTQTSEFHRVGRNLFRIAALAVVAFLVVALAPSADATGQWWRPSDQRDNKAPTVAITSPANLSSHVASYDSGSKSFSATVSLSADVSDPDRDHVTLQWFSSDGGYLGTGKSIVAKLSTGQSGSSQPWVTARATDRWGAVTETSVQVNCWIPSDGWRPPRHRHHHRPWHHRHWR
jgi:hypothetical protein